LCISDHEEEKNSSEFSKKVEEPDGPSPVASLKRFDTPGNVTVF
jgi:hypothetical protein